MNLNVSYHGNCPVPFYDASLFPSEGGYIGGRLCASQDMIPGNPTCCLPCPATYWTYPDSFSTYNTIAAWLNVAGFTLLLFLLTSYFFLPVQRTRSHYLSISLIVAICFINLGFIVPLGAQPDQCYNEITPHDMYSSMTCAWSGAFIIAGGISGAVWIFVRALSMHLQICWDIVPGRKFFYLSQALGWGVPAAIFAATITVTGVSFRFGNACHVNHEKSMQSFWGWLLAIAAASVVMQLSTFAYCAHVFITNLWSDERPPTQNSSSSLPTYTTSIRTQTAKAIWRRLKSVLLLQWRGILIVTITLVDVIFFAVVFVYLDGLESSLISSYTRVEPWVLCLILSGGDKSHCLAKSEQWLINESVVGAVLIMLSLIGIEVFCLLFRRTFLTGWKEFFAKKFSKKEEFVSLNALSPQPNLSHSRPGTTRKQSANGIDFEMQKPSDYAYDSKTLSPIVTSVLSSPELDDAELTPRMGSPPHFGPDTPEPGFSGYYKTMRPPSPSLLHQGGSFPGRSLSNSSDGKASFSSSRVPSHHSTARSMGWDPTSTYAPAITGGARLIPVFTAPFPRLSDVGSEDRPDSLDFDHRPDSRGYSPGQAL